MVAESLPGYPRGGAILLRVTFFFSFLKYVVLPSSPDGNGVSEKECVRGGKLKNMNVNLVMKSMKYRFINSRVGFSSFFFIIIISVLTQITCKRSV